jgi:hypothetical protein
MATPALKAWANNQPVLPKNGVAGGPIVDAAKKAQDNAEGLGTSKKAWLAAASAWDAAADIVAMNKSLSAQYKQKANAARDQAKHY